MNHIFIVRHGTQSKYVRVEECTDEYALSYVSGYVQALRDKLGDHCEITILKVQEEVAVSQSYSKDR